MEVTFNNFDEFLQYHVRLRKQIEEQQEKIYELERDIREKQKLADFYHTKYKEATHGNE